MGTKITHRVATYLRILGSVKLRRASPDSLDSHGAVRKLSKIGS